MSKTVSIPVQVPDWVRFIAQNESGPWYGFIDKPFTREAAGGRAGFWDTTGQFFYICDTHTFNPNWRETLREVE